MKKLTVVFFLAILCACHKENVSNSQSSSQNDPPPSGTTPSPTQKQSVAIWPIVNSNYWVFRDSTFNSDGTLMAASLNDSIGATDSTNFNSKFYFGPDPAIEKTYYRENDDSTIEYYNDDIKASGIFFKEVNTNNSLVTKIEGDVTLLLNGTNKTYHVLHVQTGYTDLTKVNEFDSCIRNELIETYSGDTTYKCIIYMKPGVGMVKYLLYLMKDETPGKLYLYFKRELLTYHIQ
jgi:hypothetical protein